MQINNTQQDKAFWGNMASVYNKMFDSRKAYLRLYDNIKHALNANMDVLEIGTGTGLIARAIASTVKSVHATDFSDAMISAAKAIEHAENIEFSVQDGNHLNLADACFDAVVISNVLHIIDTPEQTLKEIHRVLKKGFPIYSEWDSDKFCTFLHANHFEVTKRETIKWGFNICYAECVKID